MSFKTLNKNCVNQFLIYLTYLYLDENIIQNSECMLTQENTIIFNFFYNEVNKMYEKVIKLGKPIGKSYVVSINPNLVKKNYLKELFQKLSQRDYENLEIYSYYYQFKIKPFIGHLSRLLPQ